MSKLVIFNAALSLGSALKVYGRKAHDPEFIDLIPAFDLPLANAKNVFEERRAEAFGARFAPVLGVRQFALLAALLLTSVAYPAASAALVHQDQSVVFVAQVARPYRSRHPYPPSQSVHKDWAAAIRTISR